MQRTDRVATSRVDAQGRSWQERGLVPRERLTSSLLADRDASTVLIVAPAGYGKTTVVQQWDGADERSFAWITLNDHHNDPAHLLESIARNLGEVNPIDQGVFDALSVPRPSISNVVVPRLVAALARYEQEYVLVLDDVHLIREPACLSVLSTLAEEMPPWAQLTLVGHTEHPGVPRRGAPNEDNPGCRHFIPRPLPFDSVRLR